VPLNTPNSANPPLHSLSLHPFAHRPTHTTPQVDALRSAGASELQRRRSLEATLKQAAALFRKELACKSDEVAGLQGQLRAMRHELTTSNAYSAAAVAEAGAARAAAAATAAAAAVAGSPSMAGSPCVGRCCSPVHAAAGRLGGAAPAAAAAAVTGGAREAALEGGHCSCSSDGGGGSAAAAAVAAELQALRASRANYQSVVLQQQAVRNSLLGSLGEVLQVGGTAQNRAAAKRVHGVCSVLPQQGLMQGCVIDLLQRLLSSM